MEGDYFLLKGKCLNENSTIGILAPASPEKENFINNKLSLFKSLCFSNIKLGKHLYNKHDYLAGNDKDRASDINDMFNDDSIDGIICFRGGYGSIRTLQYIDDSIIKCHPKFFCGFSDITLLLNHFRNLGLICFHGPMINSNLSDCETVKSLLDISKYNFSNYSYNLNHYCDIRYINDDSFSGQLIGGNLATICSSIGTPYEVKGNNFIILLEEVNEEPYVIDRMLTELIFHNFFDSCNGIIIGHVNKSKLFDLCYKNHLQQVFINRLKNLHIPMIIGFPFGHDYPNFTIPIGCNAHYSKTQKQLILTDSFLI